mmetsp:Transcript_126306/g.252358  ORF Transcript_126306/g.252358 Transcript_126306/m.252358 type:complete len:228 (-) Transcript_126306:709-1392(-)
MLVIAGYLVKQELHHTDSEGEHIATRKPGFRIPRLRWNVTRGTARNACVCCCHCPRNTKINENYTWGAEVARPQHDIGFFDVAMHQCLLMQKSKRLEALTENYPPPIFCHGNCLLGGSLSKRRKVATVVGLTDHVVIFGILKDLKGMGNEAARHPLQRLELIPQFRESLWSHFVFGIAFDTPFPAEVVRCKAHHCLAASSEGADNTVARFIQRSAWHINLADAPKPF